MPFDPSKLREARESMSIYGRRVSQEQFASMIGVSKRSPGRWENGEAEPRMAQLTKIAEVTGRPIGFFFDEPAMVSRTSDLADAFRMFADLLDGVAAAKDEEQTGLVTS